jgi:hypothetical protein
MRMTGPGILRKDLTTKTGFSTLSDPVRDKARNGIGS